MYVRNYGEGVDLPWREAFQTDDRGVVEEYCRQAGATVEWRDKDRLRTRSVRQVMVEHPRTGDKVWFNHAHMFHVSNLQPAVRASLLPEFAPDELPRNAFYGDGTPIEDAVLEHIRQVYQDTAVAFPWRRGTSSWSTTSWRRTAASRSRGPAPSSSRWRISTPIRAFEDPGFPLMSEEHACSSK